MVDTSHNSGAPDVPVPDRSKNIIGPVSLICAILAAALVFLTVVGHDHVQTRTFDAMGEAKNEEYNIGREPTPEERLAIDERYREKLSQIKGEFPWGLMSAMYLPGVALTLGAIALAIIGLSRKCPLKGLALGGFFLGMGLLVVEICLVAMR